MTDRKPFDMAGMAQTILSVLGTYLQRDPDFDLPDWQYTTGASQIAFDSEQFVVFANLVYPGDVGLHQPGRYVDSTIFAVEFGASLVRCLDVELPLSNRDLQIQGDLALTDASALLLAAIDAHDADELVPGCNIVQIGPVNWTGPAGAVVGTTLSIIPRLL